MDCYHCHDCFGCSGLVHKAYCIFNRQYEKKEYEELRDRIIAQMKQRGEWGRFFPTLMSPFCYNESLASCYVSLEKEEAQRYHFPWRDETEGEIEVTATPLFIPDSLRDFDEQLRASALNCIRSGRAYRITKQELEFYRRMDLPVPRLHPDERIKDRRSLLRPKVMTDGVCGKTGVNIRTTMPVGKSRLVYANEAYVAALY